MEHWHHFTRWLESHPHTVRFLLTIVIVIGAGVLAKVLEFVTTRGITRRVTGDITARQSAIVHFAGSILRYVVYAIAILCLVSLYSGSALSAIFSISTLVIVFGFVLQHGAKDFVSGAFLLLEGPYKIGDYIYINENVQGEVEHMQLRTTTLRNQKQERVVVINTEMKAFRILNSPPEKDADQPSVLVPVSSEKTV